MHIVHTQHCIKIKSINSKYKSWLFVNGPDEYFARCMCCGKDYDVKNLVDYKIFKSIQRFEGVDTNIVLKPASCSVE